MKYYFDEVAHVSTRRRIHAHPECIVAARLMGVDLTRWSEGDTAKWNDIPPRRCVACDAWITQEKEPTNAMD